MSDVTEMKRRAPAPDKTMHNKSTRLLFSIASGFRSLVTETRERLECFFGVWHSVASTLADRGQ
jgi:hypothetical protein